MTNRAIVDITRGITIQPIVNPTIAAGIYHNSTLGLISLSSDGTNRITIADKNLGATQVYNTGDEISQTNCGGTFQRGNNYMFSLMGTIQDKIYGQTNAANYGPYYYSDVFITGNNTGWLSVQNNNLWGGVTDTVEAKQGPCPNGYHIPSKDENVALVGTLTALGIDTSNGECMKNYLKMPYAGQLTGDDGGSFYTDLQGSYWSSTGYDTTTSYRLVFGTRITSHIYPESTWYTNDGFSIRAVKNVAVVPNSSWTTLYSGAGSAGIFHDTANGLISLSSDGINWITIQDKNLGATVVYENGDTLSESNCGGFFQWGNNYMFPFSSATTTSSTQVNATNYGPYYYSDTFRCAYTTSSYHLDTWDSTDNRNLWGFVTGTNKAMKGPCNEGFHIPSVANWESLIAQLVSLGIIINEDYFYRAFDYLKIGGTTIRYIDGTYDSPDSLYFTAFWCANRANYMTEYGMRGGDDGETYYGMPIRPFKNEPVVPNSSRTKLY